MAIGAAGFGRPRPFAQDFEMKTLKSKKPHDMARSRKTASGGGKAIGTKRSISPMRGRSTGAKSSVPRAAISAGIARKGSVPPIPQRPHVDVPYQTAVRNFEMGVRAFQKQKYHKAAEVFEKLVDIDARDVAERAQVHLRLCRQRTGRPAAGSQVSGRVLRLGRCLSKCPRPRARRLSILPRRTN